MKSSYENLDQLFKHIEKANPAHAVSMNSRIILVDDDEDLRKLIIHKFKKSPLIIDESSSVQEAKHMLYENDYELILLDLMMEPESGYFLFDFLKHDPKLKWIPLIVLSGSNDIKDKVRCLNMGADDYVTKPFHFEDLNARVQRILARSKQFEQMAFCDALTGIYNRRYFDNQLIIEMERNKRYPAPITLALIDIDHFKLINDIYGHPIGDQVLQRLAYLLKQNLRNSDLIARYGGEEFVVLLSNTTEEQATVLMNRILEKVRTFCFAEVNTETINITFSAGIAPLSQDLKGQEWIKRADTMLYQAKQLGRNRVMAWSELPDLLSEEKGILQKKLSKTILIIDAASMIHSILDVNLKNDAFSLTLLNVKNEENAMVYLEQYKVDLCIIDIGLPQMTTLTFLEKIKHNSRWKHMKVMALTSRSLEPTLHNLSNWVDDHMVKPYSILEFNLRCNKLLNLI
ncbi:diguanylate cyclase [Niallia sp. 01092]|uniref:diguanylate cyclase n=1 Tax=unclassified Niallia TaxID=2837522 RepID=UPI003FD45C88